MLQSHFAHYLIPTSSTRAFRNRRTMTTPIPQPPTIPFLGNALSIEREVPLRSYRLLAKQYGEIFQLDFPGMSHVLLFSCPRMYHHLKPILVLHRPSGHISEHIRTCERGQRREKIYEATCSSVEASATSGRRWSFYGMVFGSFLSIEGLSTRIQADTDMPNWGIARTFLVPVVEASIEC